MAHTARTRFPARPWKKSGRSRILGLKNDFKCGFDAALPVSAAISKNLHKFHDLFGESSSSEDEQFLGFCSDDNSVRSPARCHFRSLRVESPQRKLRGRQRTFSSQSSDVLSDSSSALSPPNKLESKPVEKEKKQELNSSERKRGRPPVLTNPKLHITEDKKEASNGKTEKQKNEKEKKVKKKPALLQQVTKIKKLRVVKLSPLQSKLKKAKLQINSNVGKIERKRGRPPSSERLKTIPKLLVPAQTKKQKSLRKEKDGTPIQKSSVTKEMKSAVRQRPRRITKPVRVVPVTKRTDAAIAKQLLQRAKKGAQKRMASPQLKNIRQFIMPVISAISSRIIKTPKRFIEDDSYVPPIKAPRLESTPTSRFSSVSCGSSEKSSAVSQHSSQMSSDSSRSSSPSVTSTDSQVSDELQTLSEVTTQTTDLHSCLNASQSNEPGGTDKKGHRFPMPERSNATTSKKLPTSSPQPTSSSPPPPLLSPPPPLQQTSNISDHSPWLMPPTIPFISPPTGLPEKRKSILREPTFKWTSLKNLRPESHQYFSSAKYAKEGLIRKPIFDNFITSPLTPEDVGLSSRFHSSSSSTPPRFFSSLHPTSRFDTHKRSPLLRAPRFTPSEAHSRIFESVTVSPRNLIRSSVSVSGKGHSSKRKNRELHISSRIDPKSPSHSMRTRSGRLISADLSPITPQTPITSSSPVSSILTGALTPPLGGLVQSEGATKDKDGRVKLVARQTSTPGDSFSAESASPTSPLFPSLTPSTQKDRGKSKDKQTEEIIKERDFEKGSEKDRERDKEKENKRETRKEKKLQNKGTEPQSPAPLFLFPVAVEEERTVVEDVAASSSIKKVSGRAKRTSSTDKGSGVLGDGLSSTHSDGKNKSTKKGRLGAEEIVPVTGGTESSTAASISNKDKPPRHSSITSMFSSGTLKHSAPAISSMLAQADKMPTTDKRVANLLRKAKAQLCKIEKNKSLKIANPTRSQGQESDSSETSIPGPRIKHVCRRAAVALGRKRAVFPDDMPTLSALPWEEREKILSSMGNDDKSSVAGSEDAEPPTPVIKPVAKHKVPQEPVVRKGRRSRRCGQCPGCQVPDDCGQCTNCLDKPKFGGRNVKKQCCKMRKCQNLQWMPSKVPPPKPVNKVKKKEKKTKLQEKKEAPPEKQQIDTSHKNSPQSVSQDHIQKVNQVPHQQSEQQSEEGSSSPLSEAQQQATLVSPLRKPSKQLPQPLEPSMPLQPGHVQLKKESTKSVLNDPKKKQPLQTESAIELSKQKKPPARFNIQLKTKKPKEKDKVVPVSKFEPSTLNLLTTFTNVSCGKQKPVADGVHRIRVDFKEDCDVENVWEMGGLSILTSVPITPRVVCFLCASSGQVEFIYCQVCCEPFHLFCLEENERPLEEQWENWCCRRCKFCHVCCRQNKSSKQLLECGKCRNSYHPECLGPNYPTKPTKKKKVWICTKCVRCKSCGATTPGKGWDAQWSHDFSLCHECEKLFDKGNFCPLCDKCYDDDDYESKMMQCGKCDRWVHAKCESLSDEMYEILSNLPESVAYTCINCTEQHPAEWRLALGKELQISLKQVLTALLNSRTTSHLLRCRQTVAEDGFEVLRRIFVDFEDITLRRKFLTGLEPESIHMMIGSMTIDSLGILNDLSDCEAKLFPIGYQCSRVYWSTTDARKRCVYTCKILEHRPPPVEAEENSTLEHNENRTVAHSPSSPTEIYTTENQNTGSSEMADHYPTPYGPGPIPPRSQPGSRTQISSFFPSRRSTSSGSRPLPSPGSPTPLIHEKVTFADALLSSGRRSTISRRHSTTSVSPQHSRHRMASPSQMGITYVRSSSNINASPLTSLSVPSDTDAGIQSGETFRKALQSDKLGIPLQAYTGPSSRQRIGSADSIPVHHTGVSHTLVLQPNRTEPTCTGHHSSTECSLTLSGNLSRSETSLPVSTLDGLVTTSVLPPTSTSVPTVTASRTAQKEARNNSALLTNSNSVTPLSKDAKTCMLSFQQKDSRRPNEQSKDTVHAGKSSKEHSHSQGTERTRLQSAGASHTVTTGNEYPRSNCTEKRLVTKVSSADFPRNSRVQTGKHFEESPCSDSAADLKVNPKVSSNSLLELVENTQIIEEPKQIFNDKSAGTEHYLPTSISERIQPPSDKIQADIRKKEMYTSQKQEIHGYLESDYLIDEDHDENLVTSMSASSQEGDEPLSSVMPPSMTGSPENEQENLRCPKCNKVYKQRVKNLFQKHVLQCGNQTTQEDGDGNKTQDNDSNKRRYPRRSARARSTTFFGLTPFYGVKSYGEEDFPFYRDPSGKKRGEQSTQGQVDGADDPSTSSDEDVEYYYNFTRTVITSDREGRLEPCSFFDGEEDCRIPRISQLDGVDDDTESDVSVTATAGKATQVNKIKSKENGTESLDLDGAINSGTVDGEKENHGIKSVSDLKSNDSKLDNCIPVSRVKSQGQDSLGEVSLTSLDTSRRGHSSTTSEKNLLDSFNTDLLKAANDSDNNNSDDCGNILPSDIMDFVLKNTQSMQALGESPESSSSELITLSEGLGLVSNRGKDMGSLFEVFSQPLPSTEPVESVVSASIPAEEPFELPLELPSDLSVLTTCSPAVSNQSHSSLTVISTSQLTPSEDQSVLNLPASETVEKGVTVTGEKSVTVNEPEVTLIGHQVVEPSGESHMASDQFIQSHIDTDQLTSPTCTQVEQGLNSQDLTAVVASSPVVLPVSVSPSVLPQGQKYVTSPDSPGPTPVVSSTTETATPLPKPGTGDLIIVNQHGHPLYVLQTLPNGVTQEISLTPSLGTAQAVIETNNTVLGQNVSMGCSLALATGLNVSLPASQSIYTSATMTNSSGLMTLSQHPQLHSFAGPPASAFQPNNANSGSSLLIGVQSPQDPQLLSSEPSQRPELVTAMTSSTGSTQVKKRPINRLPSKKGKKLAPSYQQTSGSSEIVPNITSINFSSSQVPGGIANQSGLVDLGALTNTGPQRTIPNIIKRPKSAVMYFEQASLAVPQLQQTLGAVGSTNIIGPESSHLAAGNVSGLGSGQSVLNVVSMHAATTATSAAAVTGHILGQSSVTLAAPMLLGTTDITGSISNLLIKASQQSLGLSDQAVSLPGTGMFQHLGPSHSPNSGPLSPAQSICLLPSTPAVTVPVVPSPPDQEGTYQLHQRTQMLPNKCVAATAQLDAVCISGGQLSTTTLCMSSSVMSNPVVFSNTSMTSPAPVASVFSSTTDQSSVSSVPVLSPGSPRSKPRVKRTSSSSDKPSNKKHKVVHVMTESCGGHQDILESDLANVPLSSSAGSIHVKLKAAVQDAMEFDEQQHEDCHQDSDSPSQMGILQPMEPVNTATSNTEGQDDFVTESKSSDDDDTFTSPLLALLEQEEKRREIRSEKKSKKGLLFQITSDDGFQIQCDNIEEGWKVLTDKVQEARTNARLKHISFSAVNGLKMLGISHDAVVFLIEQLYGAKRCKNYNFKFHKHQEVDELPVNPHGSARAEIHQRKSAFDMFNFLASKHRQPPDYCPNEEEEEEVQLKSARRATSMDLPMAMRFRHLKKTSKEAVGVYRSPIHGRGLFCKRNIDAGEMVIEYSGTVIRSVLTDKREKYYDSKGIGCYMFRIDDYEVVDATMHGNAARFINHSCEPNCYSRVINVDGQKHIVIFAVRKIYRGEELTYDYKFPIEDASNKLPCNCGAKKCRKFLN
ncbi:histone-lysine N-methyltransferase 2A isoform X3 [Hypanus sabinus]|uniref:histone-lysine N-methyltransferase 2A isoform X3 n=1 Tax=Hypanus sabinus TaxID=79690 RepID=UPI0028C488D3|nr:histone-lysine N-methyltransferase 2A isoform X3 [Hypanus sabinus]